MRRQLKAVRTNAAQSEIYAAQSAAASGDAAIVSQEAEALINAKLLGAFAADPATTSAGAVYYNTVQKVIKVYDADSSTWKVAYADASQVGYDHASSGLESTDLQEAVDELNTKKITRPTSTDKAIPRFSGSSGDLQNSGVTIDDSGNITPTGIFLGGASTANLLDDYEEGTFTPSVIGQSSAGLCTCSYSQGNYTKIGNMIFFTIKLAWADHTGTGNMRFTGLPFTPIPQNYYKPMCILPSFIPMNSMIVALIIGTNIDFRNMTSTGIAGSVPIITTTQTTAVEITGIYLTL